MTQHYGSVRGFKTEESKVKDLFTECHVADVAGVSWIRLEDARNQFRAFVESLHELFCDDMELNFTKLQLNGSTKRCRVFAFEPLVVDSAEKIVADLLALNEIAVSVVSAPPKYANALASLIDRARALIGGAK